MFKVIHHVGIVTEDIIEAQNKLKQFGLDPGKIIEDTDQDVKVCLASSPNNYAIELVAPLSEKSPALSWLKRIKSGVYHICFEVEDINLSEPTLRNQGFIPTSKKTYSPLFETSVQFFFSPLLGLIELLEKK